MRSTYTITTTTNCKYTPEYKCPDSTIFPVPSSSPTPPCQNYCSPCCSSYDQVAYNFSRLSKLNEKLDGITTKIEEEKQSKELFIHSKLNDVESKLDDSISLTNKKFSEIKSNLLTLNALLDDLKQKDQLRMEQKSSVLFSFEKKVEMQLDKEIESRKILEHKMTTLIEDKYNELRLMISQEGKNRFEEMERIKSVMERDMPSFLATPKYEGDARRKGDDAIKDELNKGVSGLKDKILNEKKIRESNEEAFLESLKISMNKFKSDVNGERNERKNNLDKMISLLQLVVDGVDLKHEELV